VKRLAVWGAVLAACTGGCTGSSDSEVRPQFPNPTRPGADAGAATPMGSGSQAGPDAAAPGSNAPPSTTDAATPTSPDAGADPGEIPPGAVCPAPRTLTLGVHVKMLATWPATTAAKSGSDTIHIWNLAELAVDGTRLAGDRTRPCGTLLPPFELNAAGSLVTGGSRVQIRIPDTVWDAPSIPRLQSRGSIAGFDPGSPFAIDGTVALVGLELADAAAPWPDSYGAVSALDADDDGHPGFTAVPRTGEGFVQPPTGLGIFGSAPTAEQLFLASRTVVSLEGTLTACDEVSGVAKVAFFDSHVVGCLTNRGAACTPAQTDFVDQSRTLYEIESATFQARKLPEGATCADVRAALPPE